MNPNEQYFQQQPQQPGYGVPPLNQGYNGPPRTPLMPQQQQFPNGPQGPYSLASPRPPAMYGNSPLPNQLAQQMGGMSLADPNLKSPLPSAYPPVNGNASPAMFPPRPQTAQAGPGLQGPPRVGLMPPMAQQPLGMSPQQYQNGGGNFDSLF